MIPDGMIREYIWISGFVVTEAIKQQAKIDVGIDVTRDHYEFYCGLSTNGYCYEITGYPITKPARIVKPTKRLTEL